MTDWSRWSDEDLDELAPGDLINGKPVDGRST
jgi:hypothetical protein